MSPSTIIFGGTKILTAFGCAAFQPSRVISVDGGFGFGVVGSDEFVMGSGVDGVEGVEGFNSGVDGVDGIEGIEGVEGVVMI